ncbi:MAG: hypothetical protein WBI63_06410, partial [Coriobacteriia bacterium]
MAPSTPKYHAQPINYLDESTGKLVPIDETLTDATIDGVEAAVSRANRFRVVLPDAMGEEPVSIETSVASLSFRPAWHGQEGAARPSVSDVAASRDASAEVSYPEAYAGVTLSYESRKDGLKETIVLHRLTTASVFGFDLTLEGLTPRLESDGSVSLTAPGAAGPAYVLPAPCMWDASYKTSGTGFSDDVRYELSGSAPAWRLDIVADAEWLASPERVYPVMIDPYVVTSTAVPLDTYVSSKLENQNTNFSNSTLLWVNNHDPAANWTEYGLAQPGSTLVADMAAKKASGYEAVASRLKYYLYQIAAAGQVKGYMCTTAVNISTVTWNSGRPSCSASYSTPYVTAASGWNVFDTTAMVRNWQSAGTAAGSCTVEFQATAGAHIAYRSAQYATGKPVWEVDYAPAPTVTLDSPASGTVTAIPAAEWTFEEALGNMQVEYALEVATSPGGAPVASKGEVSAVSSTALPVLAGGYVPGTTYCVRVKAASSPSTQVSRVWSAWSNSGSFTPLLPSSATTPAADISASAGWFTEADTNGDGLNDLK